eukprot:1190122-Prorocentrum_minimum.AAC.2
MDFQKSGMERSPSETQAPSKPPLKSRTTMVNDSSKGGGGGDLPGTRVVDDDGHEPVLLGALEDELLALVAGADEHHHAVAQQSDAVLLRLGGGRAQEGHVLLFKVHRQLAPQRHLPKGKCVPFNKCFTIFTEVNLRRRAQTTGKASSALLEGEENQPPVVVIRLTLSRSVVLVGYGKGKAVSRNASASWYIQKPSGVYLAAGGDDVGGNHLLVLGHCLHGLLGGGTVAHDLAKPGGQPILRAHHLRERSDIGAGQGGEFTGEVGGFTDEGGGFTDEGGGFTDEGGGFTDERGGFTGKGGGFTGGGGVLTSSPSCTSRRAYTTLGWSRMFASQSFGPIVPAKENPTR